MSQQQPQVVPMNLLQQPPQGLYVSAQMGDTPIRVYCPNCRAEVVTKTSKECSLGQHAGFVLLCCTGIYCLCSCLPYCMSSLSKTRHICPSCKAHLGSSKKY